MPTGYEVLYAQEGSFRSLCKDMLQPDEVCVIIEIFFYFFLMINRFVFYF